MDIIVTTPKTFRDQAAAEAEQMKQQGGGEYFRRLSSKPYKFKVGDKVWYVEDGYIRGYAVSIRIEDRDEPEVCSTTGKIHESGFYIYLDAASWRWIRPVEKKGFQGWSYLDPVAAKLDNYKTENLVGTEVGYWLDPMPETPKELAEKLSARRKEIEKNILPERVQTAMVTMLKERYEFLKGLEDYQVEAFMRRTTLWDKIWLIYNYNVPMTDQVVAVITEGIPYDAIKKAAHLKATGDAIRSEEPSLPKFSVDSWWYDPKTDQYAKIQQYNPKTELYGIFWACNRDSYYNREIPRRIETDGGDFDYFCDTDDAISEFRPAYEGLDFEDATDYD